MQIKNSNGDFSWYSYAILWPYTYGSRYINRARRQYSKEPEFTEISEGWYIGGWPSGNSHLPERDCAVIDCVLELPRRITSKHYLTTPVWDTCGFTVEQITTATSWATERRKEGHKVYVHCAYGHGRSCAMLSACLVEAGLFPNFVAAFRHISGLRPRAYINQRQRIPLIEWSKGRGDILPDDMNTLPKIKPPEASDADVR